MGYETKTQKKAMKRIDEFLLQYKDMTDLQYLAFCRFQVECETRSAVHGLKYLCAQKYRGFWISMSTYYEL